MTEHEKEWVKFHTAAIETLNEIKVRDRLLHPHIIKLKKLIEDKNKHVNDESHETWKHTGSKIAFEIHYENLRELGKLSEAQPSTLLQDYRQFYLTIVYSGGDAQEKKAEFKVLAEKRERWQSEHLGSINTENRQSSGSVKERSSKGGRYSGEGTGVQPERNPVHPALRSFMVSDTTSEPSLTEVAPPEYRRLPAYIPNLPAFHGDVKPMHRHELRYGGEGAESRVDGEMKGRRHKLLGFLKRGRGIAKL